MYWNEEHDLQSYTVPDTIIDLAFAVVCRCLPVDHAYSLSQAVCSVLPWLEEEKHAGMHLIHGAESGHGWQRPEGGGHDVLYLSRRAKLTFRLPKERLVDAQKMSGVTLDVAGHPLQVGASSIRPLSPLPTLFSRYVIAAQDTDEERFLQHVAAELAEIGVKARKLLCGRSHELATPGGRLFTRRLLVADLKVEESVKLQQSGLGPGRTMGCGLFIPHKGIAAVGNNDD